ncbi:hypothetical protein PBI_HUFFY_30 [Gordonia phage Huffy]|uniref:Uncharacterized protein n=1 Tax=Gordonia phage TZGordon TaxID=2744004 RepID=A0A6N0A5A5_9CAUD|nr:hypothetical protein KDJ61_gp30 [Gordonia phage TZGordon]AQY55632.1 hypothetical protein PBI_HUFFY_30 [Gordonia phage Huffy]AQY55714.1 hypothetical protein PBI_DINODARYN_30 [Gordonia phage DinoDaryn]QKO02951.1 hypothetical protein SEA_TZGORDON_30 [Gordonia phage TZGordon]
MTNLVYWNGSTYVDMADLRAGAGRVPVRSAHVWNGSAFVKLWERPAVYSATKGGSSQTGSGANSWIAVSPMAADPAYPETVMSGNAVVIPAMVPPFTAAISAQLFHAGGATPRYTTARIRRNGVDLVTGDNSTDGEGYAHAETTALVTPGDRFELLFRGEGNFFQRPAVRAGAETYLRITPLM